MGTWGPAILSNDTAEDIKYFWKEHLGEGYSTEEISSAIIEGAKEEGTLDGDEEEYEFWISFALIQWKSGRLQSLVKEKALQMLTTEKIREVEKERWYNKADYNKRMKHLDALRIKLNSPQRKPQKFPKPYRQSTILKKGDIFTIKLKSENYVIVEIIGTDDSHKSETPIAIMYNYLKKEKPEYIDYQKSELFMFESTEGFRPHSNFTFAAIKRSQNEPIERIEFIEGESKFTYRSHMPQSLCFWDEIDEKLPKWLKRTDS